MDKVGGICSFQKLELLTLYPDDWAGFLPVSTKFIHTDFSHHELTESATHPILTQAESGSNFKLFLLYSLNNCSHFQNIRGYSLWFPPFKQISQHLLLPTEEPVSDQNVLYQPSMLMSASNYSFLHYHHHHHHQDKDSISSWLMAKRGVLRYCLIIGFIPIIRHYPQIKSLPI